jgi:uncharacterized protein (DUF1015 family)
MAEILPIKPWRYNPDKFSDIDELTSPLFDVVSEKQRKALYKNPYNSIHLSVPQSQTPAASAQKLLADWKNTGVILQDTLPGIYVYYQYFKLSGSPREYCRKGFICHIKAYDWSDDVILRHENTIPSAVNDRISLLEKTELHVSPTHGLYADPAFELEKFMDEAILSPIYETEDYQGVRDVMAVIHDALVIRKFIDFIKDQTIILADGHHRYESSIVYRNKMVAKNPATTGKEGFNYHLMYLTNSESDDLKVLPTHRLVSGINLSEDLILNKLEDDFIIKPVEDSDTLNEIIAGKQWAFGLLFKDNAYKVRLKPESFTKMKWHFPEEVKKLDLTVMHYFIIEKALGIHGKEQRQSDKISYDRSFSDCLQKVFKNEAQLAIITNEVSIDDIKIVCHSGATMPQKSTYFYPKAICGFLFTSIKDDEFNNPVYDPF